jgi:hypothetical protein
MEVDIKPIGVRAVRTDHLGWLHLLAYFGDHLSPPFRVTHWLDPSTLAALRFSFLLRTCFAMDVRLLGLAG